MDETAATEIDQSMVMGQLNRMLESTRFARSPRMRGLLQHIVVERLAGRGGQLKEYALGVDVFERPSDFDPQTNPIVRVQVSKLRRLLELYYNDEGKSDHLIIQVPTGTYVPQWTLRPPEDNAATMASSPSPSPSPGQPRTRTLPPERRQLTVFFCDLVGSTALAAELDPEDAYDLMHRYQDICAEVVTRYEGFVARYVGDGALIYFGYPLAHEDDPDRAALAALELSRTVAQLKRPDQTPLQVRIGIATGQVIVGDMESGDYVERNAVVGETPNLAARLQSITEPGTVVVSARVRRILGNRFRFSDLGNHTLAGFKRTVPCWQLEGVNPHLSRFEAARQTRLAPMHGRDQELGLLLDRWQQALEAEGQGVMISGEAGIGKSRLCRAVRDAVRSEDAAHLTFQCSPFHTDSALYPIVQTTERLAGIGRQDDAAAKLEKLERALSRAQGNLEQVLPPIAALLSISLAGRYPTPTGSPDRQKERLFQALLGYFVALTQERPVLAVMEDVHWIDPTTSELMEGLLERTRDTRVLTLITTRPGISTPWHTFPNVTTLNINRLRPSLADEIIDDALQGRTLAPEVREAILGRTDGVPLFVEELTRTVVDLGLGGEGKETLEAAIPDSLRDSLMARLDRLGATKEVAQTAAVIGREFTLRQLAAISPANQADLNQALEHLVETGLVFRRHREPGMSYMFKHALVQEAAYDSLLRRRRRALHDEFARALESSFPDVMENSPEIVARHLAEAGRNADAIVYWERAGSRAATTSANAEACHHLELALSLLRELPEGPARDDTELRIQMELGRVHSARAGYAAYGAEQAFKRAAELGHRVASTPEVATAYYGLGLYHVMRADYPRARNFGQEALTMAQSTDDQAGQMGAGVILGDCAFLTADFPTARQHYQRTVNFHRRDTAYELARAAGSHPAVPAHGFLALLDWCEGRPDAALAQTSAGQQLVRDMAPEPGAITRDYVCARSWLDSLNFTALLFAFMGWPNKALELSQTVIDISGEQGIPDYLGWSTCLYGWALSQTGSPKRGVAELSQGMAIYRGTGATIGSTWFYGLLAEAFVTLGDHREAAGALDEALEFCHEHGEGFVLPELYRLQGAVAELAGDLAGAKSAYEESIDKAKQLGARSWVLRTALRLARLEPGEGRTLVATCFEEFDEGFDTPDLKAATDLLAQPRAG